VYKYKYNYSSIMAIRDSTKKRVLMSMSSFIPRSQYLLSGMAGCTNDTCRRVLFELEQEGLATREKIENPKTRVTVDGWKKVRFGQQKITKEEGVE
jgi:hypothetical protein